MAIYFRAADHREVAAEEALDERGLLRSGFGRRVPYAMRDAAPRFAWDQHRASLLVVDARRIGGTEGNKPGYRIFDADVGRAAKEAAYAEHEAYLRDAWRTPPPDAGFGALDKKIKKYNARGQEEGYFEETEKDDAASVGDARKKEEPPVTGRSKCPECDGRGVVHGKYCQGCGGDGWVDDKDDDDNGKRQQLDPASDRRTVDQMARDHSVAMEQVYAARNREISDAWREGKVTNGT
jgi:hypothetical protein